MTRRRIVAVGLTLAAPVILATACGDSAASPPPSGAAPSSCSQQGKAGSYVIDLAITPCPVKAGSTSAALVIVRDSAGKAVSDATVRLTADMPAMKMSGQPENAAYTGTDYQGRILLGMSGPWEIKVQVQPGGGQPSEATFEVDAK